jgi:hypothetical protein
MAEEKFKKLSKEFLKEISTTREKIDKEFDKFEEALHELIINYNGNRTTLLKVKVQSAVMLAFSQTILERLPDKYRKEGVKIMDANLKALREMIEFYKDENSIYH